MLIWVVVALPEQPHWVNEYNLLEFLGSQIFLDNSTTQRSCLGVLTRDCMPIRDKKKTRVLSMNGYVNKLY